MPPTFSLRLLATLALVLAAASLRAQEGASPDLPPDSFARGPDWSRLRPSDVGTTGSTNARPGRGDVIEIPEARRAVRVVYPGLTGGR